MKKSLCPFLAIVITLCVLSPCAYAVPSGESAPVIVQTIYPTDDIVIADIVLTEAPYNADSTGSADCTAVLQQAINDLSASGGGTVWLPVGKYRLTGSVNILPFVTVRGDWADPDIYGNTYGTVIIADVPSSDSVNPALFTVGGSSGAVGLTVYYPNQSITNVLAYPFTFYVNGMGSSYMLQSIMNCTLINSYRGIGACAEVINDKYECHEMLTLENVKGTCLYQGLASYNSADVDTLKNVSFSPSYWANAGSTYNAPAYSDIRAYTIENGSAYVLGDLEWPEFCNMSAKGYKYGILFAKGPRIQFSGTFYDVNITDCVYGVYAPKGTIGVRDKSWGTAFARGKIQGSEYAVYDPGDAASFYTDVELDGKVKATNKRVRSTDLSLYDIDYTRTYTKPAANLVVVEADKTGKTDISTVLQTALDSLPDGGVCYLPAGAYRLSAPVCVPSGVELRGAGSVPTREQSGLSAGTLILSYYGYNASDDALITLGGENAGLNAIRIIYAKNNPYPDGIDGKYNATSPAVKGIANGVYAVNCCINLASVGIDLAGCDDFFIKKVIGCCYECMFSITDCEGGMIEGCLQNGNNIPRNGFASLGLPEFANWLTEDKLFDYLFIPILRKNCEYIRLNDSSRITIYNTFIYGGNCFLDSNNSDSVIINTGCDGNSKDRCMLNYSGGSSTVINSMRSTFDGKDGANKSYNTDGSTSLRLYNRLAVDLMYHETEVEENTANTSYGELFELFAAFRTLYTLFGIIATIIDQK